MKEQIVAYLKEPKTYNTIDVDYRIENIQPEEEKIDYQTGNEEKLDTSDINVHVKDL